MAFDAALAVRIGSAALFCLLGASVLAVGRRSKGAVALGFLLVVVGADAIWNNLREDVDFALALKDTIAGTLGGVGGLAVAWLLPRPLPSGDRRPFWYGLVVGALALTSHGTIAGLGGFPDAYTSTGVPLWLAPLYLVATCVYVVGLSAMVATAGARVALAPPTDKAGWVRHAGLAALLGPFLVWLTPTWWASPTSLWTLAFGLVLVVGFSLPWMVAFAKTGARIALVLALAFPLLGVATFAYRLVPDNGIDGSFDRFGMFGVLRLIGWTALVYAILRADLLGVKLPRFAVNRGVVAAGALATLFIVAQIAQNFLSAKLGLLTGGIIAGSVLFVANPVQRAMERMGEARQPAHPGGARPPGSSTGEVSYRAAVRRALKDGRVSRSEEAYLMQLADDLGLRAPRAHSILVEEEARSHAA